MSCRDIYAPVLLYLHKGEHTDEKYYKNKK